MRIAESTIALYSERTSIERTQEQERLAVWKKGGDDDNSVRGRRQVEDKDMFRPGRSGKGRRSHGFKDFVNLSEQSGVRRRNVNPKEMELSDEDTMDADLNIKLLRDLFEKLTGRKFRMVDPIQPESAPAPSGGGVAADMPQDQQVQEGQGAGGFGLAYDYHQSTYEYESTSFAAGGTITTSDGETVDFSLTLNMSREFYSEQNFSLRAGEALKDPLTVNFSGTAAQLTQRDFTFDIDSDGHDDQISFVDPGSGFLALDKNADGVINNGTELFGTASGDGFADLAVYDDDGNQWIDENDSVFKDLRIWSKGPNGEDRLVALGKAGIGALYLGHVETLFSEKDVDNALLGQVKSTGIALKESGEVVTMQQLDLVA